MIIITAVILKSTYYVAATRMIRSREKHDTVQLNNIVILRVFGIISEVPKILRIYIYRTRASNAHSINHIYYCTRQTNFKYVMT